MIEPKRVSSIDLLSCRICLSNKRPLCPLFKYKLSGNYAEMLTAIADVKVSSNDGLPEKICTKCCTSLEKAYLLKTIAERSDRELRKLITKTNQNVTTKKISFDSFTDIKSEIGPLAIKSEPIWEMELDIHNNPSNETQIVDTLQGQDIVIADTIIRKVDLSNSFNQFEKSYVTTTANPIETEELDTQYLDDDIFQDDDDDDYVPPSEKSKTKFKKPKLSDIKVFKAKPVVRKVRVLREFNQPFKDIDTINDERKSTTITCFPIMKNGTKGPPIQLKRPRDATMLKVHPVYRPTRKVIDSREKIKRRDIRRTKTKSVKSVKRIAKEREKLVCPVCGILTSTLSNHLATHADKKKYPCTECSRTFGQKSNLLVHLKQHTGVKDHVCEVCGASFYTQKSLARHNLIHKGDRPFSCNLCSKKFIARCDLNRHLRIHAGYKPFKCTTCAMSFNAKHQLQNHERMHTGERPYSCEVCCMSFSYKVNLNNHALKIHGVNIKFKSIRTVTEDILRRHFEMDAREVNLALQMPQVIDVPTPAAHETVQNTADYSV